MLTAQASGVLSNAIIDVESPLHTDDPKASLLTTLVLVAHMRWSREE